MEALSISPVRMPRFFTVRDPLKMIPLNAGGSRSVRPYYAAYKISGNFPSSGGIASPASPKVGGGGCLPYKPPVYSYVPFAQLDADYLADDVVGGSRKGGGGVCDLVDHLQHQPDDDTYDAVDLPSIGLQSRVAAIYNTLLFRFIIDLLTPSAAFASAHDRNMFHIRLYTDLATLSTLGLKAALVAALGYAAGLAISGGLVWLQNRMYPYLATARKLGLHMGLSSNFRYQVLKGLEFLMARVLTPAGFKDLVAVALRWLNNVLGKMLTPKDTDLSESEPHSTSDAEYHVNDWGEGASPSDNLRRGQRLVHLKFLVPGGKWICEVSVHRCFGSNGVIFDISVSPFFGSI